MANVIRCRELELEEDNVLGEAYEVHRRTVVENKFVPTEDM